ncbi:AAA family ATPase [Candidatus Reidiella endopervernicosa]|nr:AAA family ATPase [Candidatus Reidiella endopervernicosa]
MVLNPKGGCGKSTIATNLASYYASQGEPVILADFDPQGSSKAWLKARSKKLPKIQRCAPEKVGELMLPHGKGALIMDSPASVRDKQLKNHVKLAQTILIPVLPSPFDIRATADYIAELLTMGRVSRSRTRIAVVANRVRERTRVYQSLHRFLDRLGIPFIGVLRDTQNYIRAAEQGVGIFELPASHTGHDREQWQPIIDWLDSKESRPKKSKK